MKLIILLSISYIIGMATMALVVRIRQLTNYDGILVTSKEKVLSLNMKISSDEIFQKKTLKILVNKDDES